MIQRRISRKIHIGDFAVGGDAPISVQSMTKTDTRDVAATVRQIEELRDGGCEFVRLAVPDHEAAAALHEIRRRAGGPLIADIHFDYRLALAALEAGMDALRLNPGNIGGADRVRAVVEAAKRRGVPIRVGVNAGSLPALPPRAEGEEPPPVARRMVDAAMQHVRLLEDLGFDLIKVSLKAFDVPTTIEAYRTIAAMMPYPLHVGITEASTPRVGSIRSAVGIGALLYMGIGDTIRVSLTAAPVEEVLAGYEILKSLNLRQRGPILISCPTCGRTEVDLMGLVAKVEAYLAKVQRPLKVAVMGCVVNGPGEARDADVGIAGGKGRGVVFREGKTVRTVPEEELFQALIEEMEALCREESSP